MVAVPILVRPSALPIAAAQNSLVYCFKNSSWSFDCFSVDAMQKFLLVQCARALDIYLFLQIALKESEICVADNEAADDWFMSYRHA